MDGIVPAGMQPAADVALFVPAGARLVAGALGALAAALAAGARIVAPAIAIQGPGGGRIRVPVGGPAAAGLLRRVLGDTAFAIRIDLLGELGGFDAAERPDMQAHQLLCRAVLAGERIDVLPEPLVTGVPEPAAGSIEILEPAGRHERLLAAFRSAPPDQLANLPLLTQQLWTNARQREADFEQLYAHRFGRLTLPIRRLRQRVRRVAAVVPRRGR